jgi:hypothetical protein
VSNPKKKMSNDWNPQQNQLNEAIAMIQALRDPTRSDHNLAYNTLNCNIKNPDFAVIMLEIFSSQVEAMITPDLRQLSGLIIKNFVFPHLTSLPVEIQELFKKKTIFALNDSITDIRNTAAILIGKISVSFPISTWSGMLQEIITFLDVSVYEKFPTLIDGCMTAVQQICEDSSYKLCLDEVNKPLEHLVPKLIQFLVCNDASIRLKSLKAYNSLLFLLDPSQDNSYINNNNNINNNQVGNNLYTEDVFTNDDNNMSIIQNKCQNLNFNNTSTTNTTKQQLISKTTIQSTYGNASTPLILNMSLFIQNLAFLSSDTNSEIRASICESFTTLANIDISILSSFFDDVCVFMLQAILDVEEKVGIEACEFWLVLLSRSESKKTMFKFLKNLIENLIERFIFVLLL